MTAEVEHPVDGARAAEHPAARVGNASLVHVRLGNRSEAPVELLSSSGFTMCTTPPIPGFRINAVRSLPPGLEKKYAHGRVLRQAARHDATRRSRTNHDLVVLCAHGSEHSGFI